MWLPSTPNTVVTTSPRDARNLISPSLEVTFIGADAAHVLQEESDGNMTYLPTISSLARPGDLMVLVIHTMTGKVHTNWPTTPSGWTLYSQTENTVGSNNFQKTSIFWKIRTGSESNPTSNLTWTNTPSPSTTYWHSAQILIYRNVSATTPITQSGTKHQSTTNSGTTISSIPGITVASNAGVLLTGQVSLGGSLSDSFSTLTGDITWSEVQDTCKVNGSFTAQTGTNTGNASAVISAKTVSKPGTNWGPNAWSLAQMHELTPVVSPNIYFVGAGAGVKKDGNSGTTFNIPIPSASDSDILIMTICFAMQDNTSNQISTPADWTLISYDIETNANYSSIYTFWKRHDGTSSSVNVTHTLQNYSNRVMFGQIAAFRYVDLDNPIRTIGTASRVTTNGTSTSTWPFNYANAYNVDVQNRDAVMMFGVANHASLPLVTATPPVAVSGMSYAETLDINNDNTVQGDNSWAGIYYGINSTGSTITTTNPTTVTWSSPTGNRDGIVKMISLKARPL